MGELVDCMLSPLARSRRGTGRPVLVCAAGHGGSSCSHDGRIPRRRCRVTRPRSPPMACTMTAEIFLRVILYVTQPRLTRLAALRLR